MAIGSRALASIVDIDDYTENQNLSLEFNPAGDSVVAYRTHPPIPQRIQCLREFYASEIYRALFNRAVALLDIMPDSAIEIELGK